MGLLEGINFIEHLLRTNFYCQRKSALSFRLDPRYLEASVIDHAAAFPQIPYAVLFVKGSDFSAFHVRFANLARGGLRTVISREEEDTLIKRRELFRECYHLSYTQQK